MNRWTVGPLSVLAACLLPIAGAFALSSPTPGLVAVGGQLLAYGWLVRDLRRTLFRMAFGLVAASGVALSTWLYAGRDLDETAAAVLRILYIVLPSAMLLPRIRPSQLGDHLAQRLRLPARGSVASVAALHRVDAIADQWRQVQRARRTRGLGFQGGPYLRAREAGASAFALLVVAMRQAGTLAVAMDARGFADARVRTWAEPAPWRPVDSLLLAIAVGLAVLPWLLRATG